MELNKERDRYYVEAYANLGMKLVQGSGFFYVRSHAADWDDDNQDQDSMTAIRQIQGLLLVLGRGVLESGHMFELLTTHSAGAPLDLLDQIGRDVTMKQILKACVIDKPLPDAAKTVLVKRDIAYYNAKGNLVLADACKAFFDDLFGGPEPLNA